MPESNDPEKTPYLLKLTGDLLFSYLKDIFYNPLQARLDYDKLPAEFYNFAKGLEFLNSKLSETRVLARELSVGNLDCELPSQDNEIAASLKSLHASLKHLTWQAQEVAKGNYDQHVDFMGDFSNAFNYMIEQLNQRQKIIQDEKSRLEMYLQLILANTPNLILIFNETGRLTYASASFFYFFRDYDVQNILHKSLPELLLVLNLEKISDKISLLHEEAISGNTTTETELEIDFGGSVSVRNFRVQITPMINDSGTFRGTMLFLVDITENILARREAEAARELAEHSSRSKTNFLARMSHEIRTPMNAIMGMTELALHEDITPLAREHLYTIKQAGTNLLSIINDILDLSKIETGKLQIIPADYNLSSLIYDVINIIKTKVLESRLRFIVNIDNNIPNALWGDSVRIRQILINLLSNAVKYTEKGYISFSLAGNIVDEQYIDLTMKVSDSGKGIKQEDIEKLFYDFSRVDLKHNANIEGTGLGLAITSNLVKAMGGSIDVYSVYGEGSTFTVNLPQRIRSSEKIAVVENPEDKNVLIYERRDVCKNSIIHTMNTLGVNYKLVTRESEFYEAVMSGAYQFIFLASVLYDKVLKRYKKLKSESKIVIIAEFGEPIPEQDISILTTPIFSIPVANFLNGISDNYSYGSEYDFKTRFTAPDAKVLVVDDIDTNLKVTEGLMLPYEVQVDTSKGALDAIEKIKNKTYDVVFMDHMMPGIDGIEATARIRAMGEIDRYYKDLPIIALTANAVSGTQEMFFENGFDDFLPKPISINTLDSILERWIPKEKQIRAAAEKKKEPEQNRNMGSMVLGIEIKGLDIKKGLAMLNGSIKNYLRILGIFHSDGLEKAQQIKGSLDSGDIKSYGIYVHAIKSALANIGATGLSENAKELEIAAIKNDLDFINKHTSDFLLNLEILLVAIHKVVSKANSDEQTGTADPGLLKTYLLSLKSALAVFDSAEIKKAVSGLRDFNSAAQLGSEVNALVTNVVIGEYEKAAAMIDALLQ